MKYKSNEMGVCPKCGYMDLSYGMIQLDGEFATFPYYCKKCTQQGEESYSMSFIGHNVIDIFGNNVEITDDMLEKRG